MTDAKRKVLVIGISGPTNSGKSTVCRLLVNTFNGSLYIGQDHYFLEPGDPRLDVISLPELNHCNWEDYRALNMDQMVKDLQTQISQLEQTQGDQPVFIFVEGFSIFGWRPLVSQIHKKFFITADKDTIQQRRRTRNYNPPDVPNYFEQVVWPMHLAHLKEIEDQDDIVYFNGSHQTVESLCTKLLSALKPLQDVSTDNGF